MLGWKETCTISVRAKIWKKVSINNHANKNSEHAPDAYCVPGPELVDT